MNKEASEELSEEEGAQSPLNTYTVVFKNGAIVNVQAESFSRPSRSGVITFFKEKATKKKVSWYLNIDDIAAIFSP